MQSWDHRIKLNDIAFTAIHQMDCVIEKGAISQSEARVCLHTLIKVLLLSEWEDAEFCLSTYIQGTYGNAPESDWRNDWVVTAFRDNGVEIEQ